MCRVPAAGLTVSFNRYMVECEFLPSRHSPECLFVLIDTWWNVNIQKRKNLKQMVLVLIDTWWNVNTSLL